MEGREKELLYAAAVFLQKLLTAIADVLWLVLLAELIEEAIPDNGVTGDMGKMAQDILSLVLLSAWKRMGYSLGRSLTLKLQSRVQFRLNCQMVEKTAKIPYRLLEDYTFHELEQGLQAHINGNGRKNLVWYLVQNTGNLMIYSVRILGVSLLLARVSLPLGMLFLLLEICHCMVTALSMEQSASLAKGVYPEKQYLEELALGQRSAVERSFFAYADYLAGRLDREERIVQKQENAMRLEGQKAALADRVLVLLTYTLAEVGMGALLAGGRLPLGYFIALSVGISSLIEKNEEGDALLQVQREKRFLRQWKRFMDLPETEGKEERQSGHSSHRMFVPPSAARGKCVIQEAFGTLEFKKVSFRYPRTGRYVLRDISFQMTKGGYYAFVGVNGAGKTTIAKLLSGLYDNYEGEIRLNGVELREIPLWERRRIFAILLQDSARYEDTILRNILPREEQKVCAEEGFGENSQADGWDEKDQSMVAEALAKELVEQWSAGRSGRFPQGIHTFLGSVEEGGVALSTGECRRWRLIFYCF